MTSTFAAFLVESDGDRIQGRFTELSDVQLDPGDVTVRLQYASVNYKDALAVTGRGKIIRRFPCVGGIDAVGVVESSSSARFKPGDEVVVHNHGFGVSHHGGYAARARVPADWVSVIPDGLSALDAISIGVAGYTAALAIDLMELNGCAPSRGEVLVNGATGGLGSIAIDILALRGYEVVAVTGKPQHAPYLKRLGAKAVMASAELQAASRPLEKMRWAAAVDSLGGAPLAALLPTMGKDSVVASIGNAAGMEVQTTVMPFILRGVRLIGVNSDNERHVRDRIWQRLSSDLRPRHLADVRRVEPFERLPAVVESLLRGEHMGRSIIRLPPPRD